MVVDDGITSEHDDNCEILGEFELGLLRWFSIFKNLSLGGGIGSFSFPHTCPEI